MEIAPSISSTSFSCPHCRALAQQFWAHLYTRQMEKNGTPRVIAAGQELKDLLDGIRSSENNENKDDLISMFRRLASGEVFSNTKNESEYVALVNNLWLSRCYHCRKVSVWLHDRLAWPSQHGAEPASPDMPEDVRVDYNEAGLIMDQSPRGAAALLRLAVQKLMPHLGQGGKNINDDIAQLVVRGLDKRIQRALDIVRVVGNNAVHPGQIDLIDDRKTASELFRLVNLIVDTLITQPKRIEEMYASLPAGARSGIESRDKAKP